MGVLQTSKPRLVLQIQTGLCSPQELLDSSNQPPTVLEGRPPQPSGALGGLCRQLPAGYR